MSVGLCKVGPSVRDCGLPHSSVGLWVGIGGLPLASHLQNMVSVSIILCLSSLVQSIAKKLAPILAVFCK